MGALRLVTGLRRNGIEFPIDASISKVSEGDGKFYTVILRDVSARVVAEEALRRSKEELHELASAAHRAREQEKSRIARELHDELGQQLTALQMDVAWCREKTPSNQEAMASRLARMEALLETTVAATRRISADLRPLMLDDLGLQPALNGWSKASPSIRAFAASWRRAMGSSISPICRQPRYSARSRSR